MTHDGKETPQRQKCLTDIHKLAEEQEVEHAMGEHEMKKHERPHPHLIHEAHAKHPHLPHPSHVEHETQKTHVPHAPHIEERIHTESSPLDDHNASPEGERHERMERTELLRDRNDVELFEEAFQWGAWWQDPPVPLSPNPFPSTTEKNTPPPGNEQEAPPPPPPTSDIWNTVGGAIVSAAALAGAFALERRTQRLEKMRGKMYNTDGMANRNNYDDLPQKGELNKRQHSEEEIKAMLLNDPAFQDELEEFILRGRGKIQTTLTPLEQDPQPQTETEEKKGNTGRKYKPTIENDPRNG